jgi:uncharacterized protein with HEPN domain
VPPNLEDRLVHILDAIGNIQQFLAGKTAAHFSEDTFLRLAVERSFEIISEASRRLPEDVKARATGIDWLGVADLGNRLRHTYHRIDANLLWEIAERDLPPLKAFVERTIRDSES